MSQQAAATTTKPRALALDALRGIAILLMCLSGRVPYGELALPSWMYHAQNPPPLGALDTSIPGFTWVDLVFPMFLFSMGVAFPFAMTSRLEGGVPRWRLALASFWRFLSLGFFAIYFQNVFPGSIDGHATAVRLKSLFGASPAAIPPEVSISPLLLAFIGFVLLFPVYTRLPKSWSPAVHWILRIGGLLLVVGFLSILRYKAGPLGETFNLRRSNIILLVLANMALFGSVIWLLTPRQPWWRLSFLVVGIAAHLAARHSADLPMFAALGRAVNWSGISWLYHFNYLMYLLIVIPGTIVGDVLLRWMRTPAGEQGRAAWPRHHLWGTAAIVTLVIVAIHVGLQARWLVFNVYTTAIALALLYPLVAGATSMAERLVAMMLRWGAVWLLLGLVIDAGWLSSLVPGFDLAEGGIKKAPTTFSYYFVSLGLSILCLVVLTLVMDILGHSRWFSLLTANGQNPMIAYLGINNLMEPVFALQPLAWIGQKLWITPWLACLWAVIKTAGLAVMVSVFTRLRIVWRT